MATPELRDEVLAQLAAQAEAAALKNKADQAMQQITQEAK
jgi:hypothetical protein